MELHVPSRLTDELRFDLQSRRMVERDHVWGLIAEALPINLRHKIENKLYLPPHSGGTLINAIADCVHGWGYN